MAGDGELAVWLYDIRVAVIHRNRGRPTLTYTEEAIDRYDLGTPLLSLSLPVRQAHFPQGVVRAFLDGLLPEGEARRVIAREIGVPQHPSQLLDQPESVELLEAAPAAIASAREETPDVPSELVGLVESQLARLTQA